MKVFNLCTGGSCLSQIFWEHENLSGLSVIWLFTLNYTRKRKKYFWPKFQAQQKSGLTAVWLKWDPHVYGPNELRFALCVQETSPYEVLVLDNWCLYCKKVLDEPKVWVGDNT